MIYIAHRGNINGPDPHFENNVHYLKNALNLGYHVEVDVWCIDREIYLGHDKPEHIVDISFLENKKVWCHTKNIEALQILLTNKKVNCFWHDKDAYTITKNGYIWAYPGQKLSKNAIGVLPELKNPELSNLRTDISGYCSDFISTIKNSII